MTQSWAFKRMISLNNVLSLARGFPKLTPCTSQEIPDPWCRGSVVKPARGLTLDACAVMILCRQHQCALWEALAGMGEMYGSKGQACSCPASYCGSKAVLMTNGPLALHLSNLHKRKIMTKLSSKMAWVAGICLLLVIGVLPPRAAAQARPGDACLSTRRQKLW